MSTCKNCENLREHLRAFGKEIKRLRANLRKPAGKGPSRCKWTEDVDGNWATTCGALWAFEDGGPKENGVRYCHKCGRRVEVRARD